MTREEIMQEVEKSGGFIVPSAGDVHVNRPLTNIAIAYVQRQEDFVAHRIFPDVPVMKQSDLYFSFDEGVFTRDDMEEKRPGTQTAGGVWEVGTESYYAKVYGYHHDIPDEIRTNTDTPLNQDRVATILGYAQRTASAGAGVR